MLRAPYFFEEQVAFARSASRLSLWLAPVRQNWRVYLVMNGLFYGVVLLGMIVATFDPPMQTRLLEQVAREVRTGWMAPVARAYRDGNLPLAILFTFSVNLLVGCILTLSVPSAVIPFAGIGLALWRAALWGVLFSPVAFDRRLALLPHHLNTLLEGQCYVLAMLAAFLQGRWVLARANRRGVQWGEGLLETFRLYRLIVPLLLIAAVYEAAEVIYVAPLLR